MTIEIISWSISTKVWDRAGIELTTHGSAVRLASVARHVTDCATRPGLGWIRYRVLLKGSGSSKSQTSYPLITPNTLPLSHCTPHKPQGSAALPRGAMGLSAVCDCGISWSYSLFFSYRQVWVKFKDFSRTSKASPTVFKDLKLMKNTDLSVKSLLQKCVIEIMETLV